MRFGRAETHADGPLRAALSDKTFIHISLRGDPPLAPPPKPTTAHHHPTHPTRAPLSHLRLPHRQNIPFGHAVGCHQAKGLLTEEDPRRRRGDANGGSFMPHVDHRRSARSVHVRQRADALGGLPVCGWMFFCFPHRIVLGRAGFVRRRRCRLASIGFTVEGRGGAEDGVELLVGLVNLTAIRRRRRRRRAAAAVRATCTAEKLAASAARAARAAHPRAPHRPRRRAPPPPCVSLPHHRGTAASHAASSECLLAQQPEIDSPAQDCRTQATHRPCVRPRYAMRVRVLYSHGKYIRRCTYTQVVSWSFHHEMTQRNHTLPKK